MPIAYRCDRGSGITYAVWEGSPSREEWEDSVRRQTNDPLWPAGELYLTDIRFAEVDHLNDPTFLQQMAGNFRGRVSHLRHAIIASSGFSTADRFQESMSKLGFDCIVFTSLDTACLWLGIDFKPTERILQELRSTLRFPHPG